MVILAFQLVCHSLPIQLQHYYDVIAEKVGAEVAEIVVWEGAAKNNKIKSSLEDLVYEESYLVNITSDIEE